MSFFGAQYVEIAESIHTDRDGLAVVDAIHSFLGPNASHSTVLDIGCGFGRVSIPLASCVESVVGIDRSTDLIDEAVKRLGASRPVPACDFIAGDADAMQFDSFFDAVLLLDSVLGADEESDSSLMRVARKALRPGGYFFASSLNLAAVFRHLDAGGHATFTLETSAGRVVDDVRYHFEDGSLHTARTYESTGLQDHLVVHLWDVPSWLRFLRSFGFEEASVVALDGSAPDLDTSELLIVARLARSS